MTIGFCSINPCRTAQKVVLDMYNKSDLSHVSRLLESLGTLENLDAPELAEFADRIEFVSVARGELLLREGDEADALYLVLSGRFQVFRKGSTEPMAEIGAGYPIGEIAFFAGGPRTASVRAERDCLVLKVGRHAFDELAARIPGLWGRIAAALAQRLAQARSETSPRKHLPRTITICRAGASALPDSFIRDLRHVFELRSRCVFFRRSRFYQGQPASSPLGRCGGNQLVQRTRIPLRSRLLPG
jgi:NTE family protein